MGFVVLDARHRPARFPLRYAISGSGNSKVLFTASSPRHLRVTKREYAPRRSQCSSLDLLREVKWQADAFFPQCNSPRAKALGDVYNCDIRERLLEDTKKHFDEENGRASLPTAWALITMYCCYVGLGRDRAGMVYRSAAYDMLKRLRLSKRLELARRDKTPREVRELQRIFGQTHWGMYTFEA